MTATTTATSTATVTVTATIYLVRHAKAGNRSKWDADDSLRPLSAAGRRQAAALAERLGPLVESTDGGLLSSPATRCIETIEPLSARLGREIAIDARLAEASPVGPMLELLAVVPDGTVLSSHGDLIPDTLAALDRRGIRVLNLPDWRKCSTWVLTRAADGTFTTAESWPPPADPMEG